MDDIVQIVLTAVISGFAGAVLSAVVTIKVMQWSTNKNIKAAEERLRKELLYGDKKRSLMKLYNLVEKPYPEFEKEIKRFFESPDSEFLPKELKDAIHTEMFNIDEFAEKSGLEPPAESDEGFEEEYQRLIKSLPDWEKAEIEFQERVGGLRRSIKQMIRQHMEP